MFGYILKISFKPELNICGITACLVFAMLIQPCTSFAQQGGSKNQQELYRVQRLARNAEADGNLERSLELWRAALEIEPDNSSSFRGIQRALIGLGHYQEAIAFLDTMYSVALSGLSKLDPVIVAADKIDILFLAGSTDVAEKEIDTLLTEFKGQEKVYTETASVLFRQRREERATEVIQAGRRECDDPFLYARDLARYHEARMSWRDAVSEYLLYLEEKQFRLNYVTGAIGDMPVEQGADSIAIATISDKIKSTKGEFAVTLRRLLASIHFKAKRYKEALEQFKLLDRTGVEPGQELLNFADLLMAEREYILAREAYAEMVGTGFSNQVTAHAVLGIGKASLALDDIDSARTAFSTILKPGSPPEAIFEAYEALGKIELSITGSPERARDMFKSALKIALKARISRERVDEVKVASALSWAKEGDLEKAQKELVDIVRIKHRKSQGTSLALYELTRVAFWQGDLEEMDNRAKALLNNDPSFDYANDALSIVTLMTDMKSEQEMIRILGKADFAAFRDDFYTARLILDSLTLHASPATMEAALWQRYHLELDRGIIEDALTELNKIIDLKGKTLRGDLALFNAGRLYEDEVRDPQAASEYYERLLIDYPDSPLVDQARRRLKYLIEDS